MALLMLIDTCVPVERIEVGLGKAVNEYDVPKRIMTFAVESQI